MNLDGKLAKALKGVGYVAFFFSCLLWFFIATFPDEAARDWAQIQGSSFLGSPLQIEEAKLTGLVGIEADGIVLRLKKLEDDDPKVDAKGKKVLPPPRFIEINKLEISSSPFAFLFDDRIEFTFTAEVQQGTLSGGKFTMDPENETKSITIGAIDGLTLGAEKLLLGLIGLDVRGVLNGSLGIDMGASASHIEGGNIDLVLSGAHALRPTFEHKEQGKIGFTDIDIGDLVINASIKPLSELPKKGRRRSRKSKHILALHIEELGAESPEIAFRAEDHSAIILAPGQPIGEATLDLHLGIYLKPAFFEKTGKNFEGVEGTHNTSIRGAVSMGLIPKLARVYRDGVFGLVCTGKLSKPDCNFKRSRVKFDKAKPAKTTQPAPRNARKNRKDRKKRASGRPEAPARPRNALRKNPSSPPRARNSAPRDVRPKTGSVAERRTGSARSKPDRQQPNALNRPGRPSTMGRLPALNANVTSTVRNARNTREIEAPSVVEEVSPYSDEVRAAQEEGDEEEGDEEEEDDEEASDEDDEEGESP